MTNLVTLVSVGLTGHQHSELLRRNWLFGYQVIAFGFITNADHEVLRDYSLREKLKRKAKLGES